MNIEYFHASKFGNGAQVAQEFAWQMSDRGVDVEFHHISEARPRALPPADLYVFSSPGRMGRPIGGMRRFLRNVQLPAGTPYAILTTELAPKPDKKTGRVLTDEEICRWQRVRAIMREILDGKGLVNVATDTVHVLDVKGPLEEGWRSTVEGFAERVAAAQPAEKR